MFLGWGCLDYRELTGFLPDFVHDLTKIGIIGGEQCSYRHRVVLSVRLGGGTVGSKVFIYAVEAAHN